MIGFYHSAHKPVVILVDEADATSDVQLAGVTSVSRLATAEAVVEAIRANDWRLTHLPGLWL